LDPTVPSLRISLYIVLILSLSCFSGPPTTEGVDLVHFTIHAPGARQVSLAGTFNRWDQNVNLLTGPGPDGNWRLGLPLAPGRYEYLYVIDGKKWLPDPAAPSVDDGLGGRNSVIVVPGTEGP
jgi:1,4-alpha-glucan branching enzyme